ncbi:MAG: glycosyltransferase [Bacteroidetes bacterium]|nr:MAG: glycosyltransferase [Bacteroidota bacterium]REJ99910.1 MAG: glycosyltransferase [Bacteroidota bacterium]REK35910.1 MAG: glycosyltransferase [Bacteroidota bacterium]REK50613.1 MAG: glycosyltransferase [Bacteroidota bacterium]
MKLSIVIVNYNVKYFLEQCLHSVKNATKEIAAEVFVVDNNSVDGSVEMLKQKFPSVILIRNEDNKGFSKANNQAIEIAKGEYILLLNPDTVVEEDTFTKVIAFMDSHPDAGGLGVKMIDGSGKFLPESKRGLPTPFVAFSKMSGLSVLFPKSRSFGRYHLGYLDENEVHEVDVLAGAFMLLRKSTLEKTGYLDEDFFMYGEDIDLSYRITKAGYKNYYFPDTRIIHYKGESTKKSSVNYVFVFYNAMVIFARKHFSKRHASTFSFLIKIAIYLRAGAAIASRFFRKMLFPVFDFALIFFGISYLKDYWGENLGVNYPEEFMMIAVPVYILIWLVSVFFSGGYDKPVRFSKIVRGIISGTILILVIYALLPENFRFSRALIFLGATWAVIAMIGIRLLASLLFRKSFSIGETVRKRLLIVGNEDEGARVLSLLKLSDTSHNFIGFVRPEDQENISQTRSHSEFEKFELGSVRKLREIIRVYSIDEVIFCGKDISSNQIMNFMSFSPNRELEYKIAPPESLFIIGSSSVDNPGELYVIDINSIAKPVNKRNKRLLDIAASMIIMMFSPVLVFLIQRPSGLFRNLMDVLMARKTWVGYSASGLSLSGLPKIKPGVLNPSDTMKIELESETVSRLNSLYAKDYSVYTDISILYRGWRNLGR